MKKRICITVDVEAAAVRAPKNHVDCLIWGKQTGIEGYFGINLMMDIADRHSVPITLFLDYVEEYLYGEELLNVGREILNRGHDLQLHHHYDFLLDNFYEKYKVEHIQDLAFSSHAQCRALLDFCMNAHAKVSSNPLLAQRSGGYRLSPALLEVLPEYGIVLDSSYNPVLDMRNPLGNSIRAPFMWGKTYEVPIPCLYHNIPVPRISPYNFNTAYFLKTPIEESIARHRNFLSNYFKQVGDTAIATLVMHSWSFFEKNNEGHFTKLVPDAPEKFETFIEALKDEYEFVALGDVAASLSTEVTTTKPEYISIDSHEKHCPICHTPENFFKTVDGRPRAQCPTCQCLEWQRVFNSLYKEHAFGKYILERATVLHIGPDAGENAIFAKIFNIKPVTVDIQKEAPVATHVNISQMRGVPDNTFDFVFCSNVFSYVKLFRMATKELHRVLKPNGHLICCDMLSDNALTVEHANEDIITARYGHEAYKKYKVGLFRSFGQDYPKQFEPFFTSVLHTGIDDITGTAWSWLYARKIIHNEDAFTALNIDKLKDGLHNTCSVAHIPIEKILGVNIKDFIEKERNNKDITKILSTLNIIIKIQTYHCDMPPPLKLTFEQKVVYSVPVYSHLSLSYSQFYIKNDYATLEQTDSTNFEAMHKYIFDFINAYCFYEERDKYDADGQYYIWYDTSVSTRIVAFLYLFYRHIYANSIDYDVYELLLRHIYDHVLLLCTESFYTSRHNHGLTQNIGILSFTQLNLPHSTLMTTIVEERLLRMIAERCSKECLLNEHSPEYSDFFLATHIIIYNELNFTDEPYAQLKEFIYAGSFSLEYFTSNGRKLIPLGDSSPCNMHELTYNLAQTLDKPNSALCLLPSSGYAMVHTRYDKNSPHNSSLIFSGAFHSRNHKHCDDLNIVWFEDGHCLLGDTGMYDYINRMPKDNPLFTLGFWYHAPERVYSESPHAHNVVEIDSMPYTRGSIPYGALPFIAKENADKSYSLQGTWHRPENYMHTRNVQFKPGEWLLIIDKLTTKATSSTTHTFSQWFHIGTDNVERKQYEENMASFETPVGMLYCQNIFGATKTSTHYGEKEPRLQGWYAPNTQELKPSWALGYHTCGTDAFFITILSLNKCYATHSIENQDGQTLLHISFEDGSMDTVYLD